MKLYFDEHLPTTLALMLQERGHDCLTTQAAGNVGRSDEDQLAYAAGERRVILTFNRNDFLLLAKKWFVIGRVHAGIILSRQLPASQLLRHLLHLITQHRKDVLDNQVFWLQNYKNAPPILP
ncbi:MAG: DUF5615 family PIN-like protein [Nitrospiraceae bacterium]